MIVPAYEGHGHPIWEPGNIVRIPRRIREKYWKTRDYDTMYNTI
jgi:hypothetical protein